MKLYKLFSLAALSMVSFAACNNEDSAPVYEPRYITIEANIGAMTKVVTTGNTAVFETADSISLYAWTGTKTAVSATKVVNGVKNGLGADGKWTPKTQMLWADMVSEHYFLGIYPPRTVTDFSADKFTLDASNYEESDLLVATNLTGIKATDNPVNLTFDHVMAKLNVNLSFRNQWETAPTVSSVKVTARKSAEIDYLTKKANATGNAESIALTAKENTAWSGLQIPQKGVNTITISIDGKDYVFTHTADIPLEGGQYTTVNLIVGRNHIDLDNVAIAVWDAGATINGGEAQTED